MNNEIYDYSVDIDEYTAELLRSMDKRFRAGPQPIVGDYKLSHGQEVNKIGLAFYATGYVSSRTATTIAVMEVMKTPMRNTTVSYQSDRDSVDSGVVSLSTSDEYHYPFKGVVDWVSTKLF
ncbi:MAG: hypothetical protein [Circular genetic element sp.]|nr:MAG: hypothetical protein [Circular genetic element sp.]